MNFCPNCGSKCLIKANFCSNCGNSLNGTMQQQESLANNNFHTGVGNNSLLGTMVTVQLVNGLTKNLYEQNGNYFTDKACRHQFNPAMIMSVMGRDLDSTIDTMTLMGKEVNMETIAKNDIAKNHMRAFRNRNKHF